MVTIGYLNTVTNRLARETKIDVAEIAIVVAFPISEFRALVLFGVT